MILDVLMNTPNKYNNTIDMYYSASSVLIKSLTLALIINTDKWMRISQLYANKRYSRKLLVFFFLMSTYLVVYTIVETV